VSFNGGGEPVWHPGGRELFYREGDRLMSVRLDGGDGSLGAGGPSARDAAGSPGSDLTELRPTRPQILFEGRFAPGQSGNRYYDIHPDGERFLMLQSAGPDPQRPRINVVLNWFSELEQAASR
jgi:hypothetical protein